MKTNNPKKGAEASPPSTKPSTPEAKTKMIPDQMQQLLSLFAPLLEFHKTVESAADTDLRLFWDVRLIRGKDTPYLSTTGSTSLPGVLSGSARNTLPSYIYQEVEDKIATPMLARLQDLVGGAALEALVGPMRAQLGDSPFIEPDDPPLALINAADAAMDLGDKLA